MKASEAIKQIERLAKICLFPPNQYDPDRFAAEVCNLLKKVEAEPESSEYTDETRIAWGKNKMTALKNIDPAYLLRIYNARNRTDAALFRYVSLNLDRIKERQRIENPPREKPCKKTAYPTKKAANQHLRIIKQISTRPLIPSRSYECPKCGMWHLTSIIDEVIEKQYKR